MDWTNLKNYVGAADTDDLFVQQCWTEAQTLVDNFVGTVLIPVSVRDRATLEVGSELFHRRSAPNGVAQYADFSNAPIRIARDPMVGAYPILRQFMVVF